MTGAQTHRLAAVLQRGRPAVWEHGWLATAAEGRTAPLAHDGRRGAAHGGR
jgi:hypothetical protein